jgi:acetyl-CoA C-acetyltransferase
MSKYSAGVYCTTPTPWRPDGSAEQQVRIDAWPAPQQALEAEGWATVETWTVQHAPDGSRTGIVIGRLEADNRRFVALTADGDPLLDLLATGEPIGARAYVRTVDTVNRVTLHP